MAIFSVTELQLAYGNVLLEVRLLNPSWLKFDVISWARIAAKAHVSLLSWTVPSP